jgi:uncharacterized OB-fold protein
LSDSDLVAEPVLAGLFTNTGEEVRLLAGRCQACGTLSFPAAGICPQCQSGAIDEHQLRRSGVLYAFTVIRARPPGYEGPVPYGLGYVDFADGLRVFGSIVSDALDRLSIGDVLQTAMLELGEDPVRRTYCFTTEGGAT